MYSWSKQQQQQQKQQNNNNNNNNKKHTLIYFNTNYCRKMKLVPIIIDYYLLKFNALKFFLEVHLHGGSLPNFNFSNLNPQNF